MKSFKCCLIFVGFLTVALSSLARAQTVTPDEQGTYGQLATLSDQIALLKAQAQIADLQREIAESKRSIAALSTAPSAVSSYPQAGTSSSTLPHDTGVDEPQVLAITGRGKRLSALLLMSGGAQIAAIPGTVLANGMTVEFVSPTSVTVSENGIVYALPFAGTELNSANPPPSD